ncbi:MAG: hypothetical protein HY332_02745 [Chloroflexi bacterium]|nr:hypothetical protein [Chloroflexota bacterium]
MASRALAFADPEVIRLATEAFIPVAENCSPLQTQRDAKGEFFRLVAEQGHYGGRTVPSATRQGQYAFTAGGHLLASINTREADKMRAMMAQALERWRSLRRGSDASSVGGTDAVPAPYERDPRYPSFYPEDGLVLKQTMRDLPRPASHPIPQARPDAINFDYAWFTKAEMPLFLPSVPRRGERVDLPWPIVRRLARFHLLDSVRGETPPWREDHVRHARISVEVTAVEDTRVYLRLEGAVLNQQEGAWAIRPFRQKWDGLARGYDCRLLGDLVYDTKSQQFERFDLLAVGERWGGTEHNARQEDLLPAPMGIAFERAGNTPVDRTPPHANLWDYFDIPAERRPR